MTLKDIRGWLTITENLLFSVWGECAQGAGLTQPSEFFCTVVFLSWWSCRSGVCCAKADAVVIATSWIWFLLQMGKKGMVGQQVLPQCCADSQSVALGLSVAGSPMCGIPAFAGHRVLRLPGSAAAAAGWGLVV